MKGRHEDVVAEAGRRLALASPNSRVILFGSHEKGKLDARDGVSLLVIEPEVQDEAGESVRLLRELRDLRIPAEVVVVSRQDAEAWARVRGSLVYAAIAHGRVIAG